MKTLMSVSFTHVTLEPSDTNTHGFESSARGCRGAEELEDQPETVCIADLFWTDSDVCLNQRGVHSSSDDLRSVLA